MTDQDKIDVIKAHQLGIPVEYRLILPNANLVIHSRRYTEAVRQMFGHDGVTWRQRASGRHKFDFVHYEYRIRPGYTLPPDPCVKLQADLERSSGIVECVRNATEAFNNVIEGYTENETD